MAGIKIREWAVERRVCGHVNAHVPGCIEAYVDLSCSLRGSRPRHTSSRCGAWQRKSCPYVTFLGGHREEVSYLPPPQSRLQLTLLFHPGAGKPGKTVPPPLSPRARVLSAVGSVAARMMEPYCLASDGPSSSLGPAVKTLIAPAVCSYLQQPFRPHYNLDR